MRNAMRRYSVTLFTPSERSGGPLIERISTFALIVEDWAACMNYEGFAEDSDLAFACWKYQNSAIQK